MNDAGYWGLCPGCFQPSDVIVDMGHEHWAICHEDRVRWCLGSGLFSAWQDRSPVDQLEAELAILEYDEVEPVDSRADAA